MSEKEFQPHSRRLYLVAALIITVAVVIILVLFIRRYILTKNEAARRSGELQAGPHVQVATARRAPSGRSLELPGEARPYASVTLFPKISGYLARITVDKGDQVRSGQVVAVLESPELDSQYQAAVADARNKRIFAARAATLATTASIATQDAENAEAAARIAEATAASLKTQKGYQVVRAPFAGTVTARFVDPGALLQTAASSQTSAQPIATISRTDRLRVYIYLDQKSAAFVKVGDKGLIADAARPGSQVAAQVSRISGELDVKTRTMLVELDLDNRSGKIPPGGFVQVKIDLVLPPAVAVPVEALHMQGERPFVVVVGRDKRVTLRPVVVGDSDGKQVRLNQGVREGEQVVLNPRPGMTGGELVQPTAAER
ncbi:efflux RND transporter periplasmic adaptor subunit [Geotalea sp. SG265]|uniref:efflux RND transporter periplasmic adaptor subunit n=1 Tax=Geotalea sp. SG265 TaxID=2922867 RepID=UPI001FAF299A|nr:efflux RND transporter periplasmic adaptor subunit [Geotalea sp. SG265]